MSYYTPLERHHFWLKISQRARPWAWGSGGGCTAEKVSKGEGTDTVLGVGEQRMPGWVRAGFHSEVSRMEERWREGRGGLFHP